MYAYSNDSVTDFLGHDGPNKRARHAEEVGGQRKVRVVSSQTVRQNAIPDHEFTLRLYIIAGV